MDKKEDDTEGEKISSLTSGHNKLPLIKFTSIVMEKLMI